MNEADAELYAPARDRKLFENLQEKAVRAATFRASVQQKPRAPVGKASFMTPVGVPARPGSSGIKSPTLSPSSFSKTQVLRNKTPSGRLFGEGVSPTARAATPSNLFNLGGSRSALRGEPFHAKPKASQRSTSTSVAVRHADKTALADCVERPEGTTDNKHGRNSARFVPWCK